VYTITYGYLSVKDAAGEVVQLMYCHRCGALIHPRGEQVHTNWHRSVERG
jgi:hypothetical protein